MRRLIIKPRADADLRALRRASHRNFGPVTARKYNALLRHAYKLLCDDPGRPGVQKRKDLAGAPCLFHLRHARVRGVSPKQPRHTIVVTYDDETLSIIRVLHDFMDVEAEIGEEPEA